MVMILIIINGDDSFAGLGLGFIRKKMTNKNYSISFKRLLYKSISLYISKSYISLLF